MQIQKCFALVSLLLFASVAQAEYQLDNAASLINFVSIKKAKIGEVHSFKKLSGGVDKTGLAQLTVDLTSVETNIAIRNERMQGILFETGMFPSAEVSTQLSMVTLQALKPGESLLLPLEFHFKLHGATKMIASTVRVVALADGGLLVSSLAPIMLNAADFALTDGIQQLMTVAKLPSIASAVPLTFSLVFKSI